MIRPLLSGFDGFTTSTTTAPLAPDLVEVFPNPTSGTLYLRPRPEVSPNNLKYQLYSMTGALLRTGRVTDRLALGDFPAGLYILEVTDGISTSRHKIVRR